jgi:GNAT superfamily N-acetyltransferase
MSDTLLERARLDVSFDVSRIDIDFVHDFLATQAYWSLGIPREVVERSIAHSLCIGAYRGSEQIGFARLVTDRATFAYLADVFVLASERGRGVARRMLKILLDHHDVQGLRRWTLFTSDMHAVYRGLGFKPFAHPERGMEIVDLDPYRHVVAAAAY